MFREILALLVMAALCSCGSSPSFSPFPSDASLTPAVCDGRLWAPAEALRRHLDADFVGISLSILRAAPYYDQVESRAGEPCAADWDAQRCAEVGAALGRSGVTLTIRRGQQLEILSASSEIVAALAPVDSPEEALLVALLSGRYSAPLCTAGFGTVETGDAYQVVLPGDAECSDADRRGERREMFFRHLIEVTPDARVEERAREPYLTTYCMDTCEC